MIFGEIIVMIYILHPQTQTTLKLQHNVSLFFVAR